MTDSATQRERVQALISGIWDDNNCAQVEDALVAVAEALLYVGDTIREGAASDMDPTLRRLH